MTVLLTHIGFEEDKKLAAMLDPEWGVDMIIGGHSHTLLEQPAEVNNILISQAGVGTDQIGRFDITVDDDTNSIVEWKWELVPINVQVAEPDVELQNFIHTYKEAVDRKYNRIISRLNRKLTHPKREEETELGNLISDIFAEIDNLDVVLVGSGSIRGEELGPVVTLENLKTLYPYDDVLYKVPLTGEQLLKVFNHILRPENRIPGESQCYQVNKSVQVVYNDADHKVESLLINGNPVQEDEKYNICLQGYHYKNSVDNLNLTAEEVSNSKVVTTSCQDVLEEYLTSHQHIDSHIEGRITFK